MTQLSGKRVLITGAAQGIGFAIARAFAEKGAEIVLTDVQSEVLDRARATLTGEGKNAHAYVMDVTDQNAVLATRDAVHKDLGPIDVLVNNAGIVFGGAFLDVPLEKHRLTYGINTLGVMGVTHAFLPDLIAKPEAHLVNLASASGFLGLPYGTTYASSKWSVIGFSESIRLELEQLGHKHVHVTTVCPSYINTGLFEGVKAPLLTPILDPKKLAQQIVRAVSKNRIFLRTPFMVKTVPLLQGLLPRRAVDWIQAKFGVTASMSFWRGHGAK
ncbi:MAG: SDR family oxidoreductase [Acidobacteria bacterium]|nr:SDR family oxidoreductase [Acidobacteriota bacterium]